MAQYVVVDASVFLATVLQESFAQAADALLEKFSQEHIDLAAPAFLRYELVSVLRKSVFKGRLSPSEALERRELLLAYPIHYFLDAALLKRGYELATQFNRPNAYDSQYLAVAEHLGCAFWTADERLYNAVSAHLAYVRWLGAFTPPEPAV